MMMLQNMAQTLWLRAYIGLAAASLSLALVWQSLALPNSTVQTFPMHFYQHMIGTLDGRSCPSYPVCSQYGKQAMQDYNVLFASWLIFDRLIHEGGDLQRGPWLIVDGEMRLNDPLERNAFWLKIH